MPFSFLLPANWNEIMGQAGAATLDLGIETTGSRDLG